MTAAAETWNRSGMEAFLREAFQREARIDLHLSTGMNLTGVVVTDVLNGTVECTKTVNKRPLAYVVVINQIVWGVVK